MLFILTLFIYCSNSMMIIRKFKYKPFYLLNNHNIYNYIEKYQFSDQLEIAQSNDHSTVSIVVLSGYNAWEILYNGIKYNESPMLDPNNFESWIKSYTTSKLSTDKYFSSLIKVRELKRNHSNILKPIEINVFKAKTIYENDTNYNVIQQLDKDLLGYQQSINSMKKLISSYDGKNTQIVNRFSDNDINLMRNVILPKKISDFNYKQQHLTDLRNQTSSYLNYINLYNHLYNIYSSINLTYEIDQNIDDRKSQGLRKHFMGRSFEEYSFKIIEDYLIPQISLKYNINSNDIFLLFNVKFGLNGPKKAASEFDCIVCTHMPRPERFITWKQKGSFCKVLGVVEIKRNPDDIGDTFLSYQRSLAWLSGYQRTYDPSEWITKSHWSGHFSHQRPYTIKSADDIKCFSYESFLHLEKSLVECNQIDNMESFIDSVTDNTDNNYKYNLFIRDLYFVTKPANIDGISSKLAAWILNKIGSDVKFDNNLSNSREIENLRLKLLNKFYHRFSTIELLKLYHHSKSYNQIVAIHISKDE